jgi:3-keto-5-aminohexanoate cleavage enzyme
LGKEGMMFKRSLIVNFAPTGAVADHTRNPAVPITLDRIVEDVVGATRAGASIAHLHVRNDDASPSCDPACFGKLFAALREHPECANLILCASTSGRHGQSPEERAAVLDLPKVIRPDMASLTLGSMNFPNGPSINAPETARYLARRMKERGVKPELEVFDVGMINFAKTLISEGLLIPPYYFNIILGNIDGLQARASQLTFALGLVPDQSLVSVGGIGRFQFEANVLGMVTADGIRIGLEDNLWAK